MAEGEADTVDARRLGAYRLERPLGEGGMGVVWSGHRVADSSPVAIKLLKVTGRASSRKRFLREARAAMAIEHPNVVRILEVGEADGDQPYIVMELLRGETLSAAIGRHPRGMPVDLFADVFVQVVSAVGTAHALGIVHRDIKPENVFLTSDGRVLVLDFGIAKFLASDGPTAKTEALTESGDVLGTPLYMSPEQVWGERGLDQRTDVWSLGAVMFECLTGRRPVSGANNGQIMKAITTHELPSLADAQPKLPAALLALHPRMMTRDRRLRMRDLREAFDVLRASTDREAPAFGPPISAPSPDEIAETVRAGAVTGADTGDGSLDSTALDDRPVRTDRRRRSRLLAMAIPTVVLVGAAVVVWSTRSPAPTASSTISAPQKAAPAAIPVVTDPPASQHPSVVVPVAPSSAAPSVSASAPRVAPAKVAPAAASIAPLASASPSAVVSAKAGESKPGTGGVAPDVPF